MSDAAGSASDAADAFQRAVFSLNLNPVAWEQVRRDAATIAAELRPFDAATADALMQRIDYIIAEFSKPAPPPPDEDLGPVGIEASEQDALPRDEAARQAFEQFTRAAGALARHRLAAVRLEPGTDHQASLTRARGAFDAFKPFLETWDERGLARLEACWLCIESAVSPRSEPRANTEAPPAIDAARAMINAYLGQNFGPGYVATRSTPLAPAPYASPTCNRNARFELRIPPGSRIERPLPRPRQILNSVERGAMEREMPLSSVGAAAFNNPFVLGEPARSMGLSCNSCHDKSGNNRGFFIPGLSVRPGGVDVTNSFFAPHANNATFDPMDIPDLRGIRFTAPYGRNGRTASLREFTRNVIVNEFNGDEPDPVLLDAMVAYLNEFDFVRNPTLNPDGTLNHRASYAARRGEAIFRRPFPGRPDQSCAACHIPSAHFIDHLRHDIGTVEGAAEFSRDRALDTPTLLGTVATAPYFHDGSMPTLRAVVEWFNQRFELGLTAAELADLTSYVETVGNGIHVFMPGDAFLEEDLEDIESFLIAGAFLVDKQKWDVLKQHYQGIGFEIRRHRRWNRNAAIDPILAQLADIMDRAVNAAGKRDRSACEAAVNEWRQLYRRNRYELR